MKKTSNFIFYDYETFGKHPCLDKPAQFASIVTDLHFNIIDDIKTFYCYPPIDYLPDPESILITGITPQYTHLVGFNEAIFSKKIYNIFSNVNSCIIGYNNIQFDDEITRNIFYRNFFNPYSWSWKNGNSRWDLLNIMYAYFVLRPESIKWPINKEGVPSFKLQDITKENNIKHYNTHDAGSDVYATIKLAKKAKECNSKLFNFLFKYRIKKNILDFVNLNQNKPILYISRFFGTQNNYSSIVFCINTHKYNNNIIIAYDLSKSVKDFILCLKNIKFKLWDQSILLKKGLLFIYINKCPILTPVSVLRTQDLLRLKIDLKNYWINFVELKKNIRIFMKIKNFLTKKSQFSLFYDVDLKIYENFLSNQDSDVVNQVQKFDPNMLSDAKFVFTDNRMNELLFRYRSRNYPNTLNNIEQIIWKYHCKNFLNYEYLKEYRFNLKKLMMYYVNNLKFSNLLKEVFMYYETIISKVYSENI